MNRYRLGLVLLAAILSVGLAACKDQEQEKEEVASWESSIATLDITEGSATLVTAQNPTGQVVEPGEPVEIRAGDKITMSDSGEGVLTFVNGAQTHLSSQAVVEVENLEVLGTSARIDLKVAFGQTFHTVEQLLDTQSRFEIETPAATISVRGTEFIVFTRDNGLTQVVTIDGTVAVAAQDKTAEVPGGYGVRVAVGEAPGEVKVWGFSDVRVSTPSGDQLVGIPIVFTNTENGLSFRYRTDEPMAVPLGTYDLLIQIPGPYRLTGIEFPADTQAEAVKEIPITLSAIVLNAPENLIVRLQQGDLSGEIVTAPGVPILVGPGTWNLEIALESQPDEVQTIEVTVDEGKQATMDFSAGR